MNTSIVTRLAIINDIEEIAKIAQSHEPLNKTNYIKVLMEQIEENYKENSLQKIFVALINDKVVGHAKLLFFDPERMEVEFSSPLGWYFNGVIVNEKFRKIGVATKLSECRINYIKENSNNERVFSIVSSRNKASILYHKSINFKELKKASGFLNIKVTKGVGILFSKEIN